MKKLSLLVVTLLWLGATAQVNIKVQIDPSIQRSFTGKLYLFTQPDTARRVSYSVDPALPFFAWDIKNVQQEMSTSLDKADHRLLPEGLSRIKPGYYKVAAIIDANFEERGFFNPGNVYSQNEVLLHVNEQGQGNASLLLGTLIQERKFRETESVKEVVLKSQLLSNFRKKDITMKAAVRVPASYHTEPNRQYPVVFVIPGWGGTHYDLMNQPPVQRYGMDQGKEKIYVYLNPETQSPFGLHAFVDSRVNGPWGKALVEELIPHLEQQYRIVNDPNQRFVMGQSTGGYGSLWLQLHYPNAFGGCWAVSPDPVDFSSFIGIDLYEKDVNIYTLPDGSNRPFFLMNGKPLYTTHQMMEQEIVIGDGEQIQAFEAEFGLPDKNGRPRELFNRKTGKVDHTIVKSWEPYDLGLFIQKNWPSLATALKGKVHVYAGANDNFLLNDAVMALGAKARSVNADVVAELIPNADHWSIWNADFTKRVQAEIDARIR